MSSEAREQTQSVRHVIDFETLGILVCPLCGGRLRNTVDGLICPADGATFPIHPSGLLDLRPPDGRAAADAFAAQYRAGRLADGWQPLSPEVARALPDGDPPGFTRLYWTVRRESWAALAKLLGEFGTVPHGADDTNSAENTLAEHPELVEGCGAAAAQGRIPFGLAQGGPRRAQDARRFKADGHAASAATADENASHQLGPVSDRARRGSVGDRPQPERAIFRAAPLTIADLGAGFPWLSHRLASLGHAVLAVDLSPDADFGLGAARLFPTAAQWGDPTGLSRLRGGFLPALGDLERPPLAQETYDVVICNASLHYAADLSSAVARLARTLQSGGALVITDSPILVASRPGRAAGRGLERASVEDALRDAGLTVAWHPVPRGWLWRRHQLKNRLLRRPGFEFPIVVGTKVSAS